MNYVRVYHVTLCAKILDLYLKVNLQVRCLQRSSVQHKINWSVVAHRVVAKATAKYTVSLLVYVNWMIRSNFTTTSVY